MCQDHTRPAVRHLLQPPSVSRADPATPTLTQILQRSVSRAALAGSRPLQGVWLSAKAFARLEATRRQHRQMRLIVLIVPVDSTTQTKMHQLCALTAWRDCTHHQVQWRVLPACQANTQRTTDQGVLATARWALRTNEAMAPWIRLS